MLCFSFSLGFLNQIYQEFYLKLLEEKFILKILEIKDSIIKFSICYKLLEYFARIS